MDILFIELEVCSDLIEKGGNISWLNKFCAAFHEFASKFKLYLPGLAPKYDLEGNIKLHVETIFLCFTQVLTCITQVERIINIESSLGEGVQLLISRKHFLDRMQWCIKRLQAALYLLYEETIFSSALKVEELSFVELLDLALEKLETYNEIVAKEKGSDKDEDNSNPQLVLEVNHIIRHALAFANVALESDKKALNAICETVLNDCSVFEKNFDAHNPGERKLEALSLQRSIYSLETYLNEALLRLIFHSLLDVEEISVNKLKSVLQNSETSPTVDKIISDFDINMDRIQQIGVFAIAFTTDVKTKTIVRSCLASLESLDSCIVPAFKLQGSSTHHADILELHFKEELVVFRNVIHEILDSRSLISNYLDLLAESMLNVEKLYPNGHLLHIAQMGNVLFQHFQLKVNYQELDEVGKRLHEDFLVILGECQAILDLTLKVDKKRILKRLKILYSVLAKLRDAIDGHINPDQASGSSNTIRNTLTKSNRSKTRHRFSAKPLKEYPDCKPHENMSSAELNQESDLISFQLTEILRLH